MPKKITILFLLICLSYLNYGQEADKGKIAFSSDRDGNYEIYVMDADGENVRRVTYRKEESDDLPYWSPDGKRIVFRSVKDTSYNIFIINEDGTGITQLTRNYSGACNPKWSPDGQWISFEASVSS